jgi:ABC-2 type transport system ATP-binding protein
MNLSVDVPAIETQNLVKRYAGGVLALKGLDLTVKQGEVFGLLGPNGAGKSTTIRILLDMIRPTSGHAHVLGFDTQSQSVAARGRLGYLPSDPQFYARMTGHDLFAFVAKARGLEDSAAHREYLAGLIRRLELDSDRRIRTLSRGNKQKVGIVAALMARPDVLILDEPTSALDPLMQEVTNDLVREVAAEGRTVFFSSHILPEVEQVCDRVAVLREGERVGVFDLAEQRKLASRQVTVQFESPVTPADFEGLLGVRVIEALGPHLTFEVRDGFDALVKRLGAFTVVDIEAREPTLEEFFFALYAQPAAEAAVAGAAR